MDIGEVSKRSGVTPATLRYYEQLGLIASSERKGLRRQYFPNVLEILAFINLAKLADFRLDELAGLFKLQGSKISIHRADLKKKAHEIERKIKRLEAARAGLVHVAECRAPSHLECSKFRRLLVLATRRQIKARGK